MIECLGALLGQLGGGRLLDSVLGSQPTPIEPGNEVLGQIFGSKDVSRSVADHAAGQTGISAGLLKQMLPILASLHPAEGGWSSKIARTTPGSSEALSLKPRCFNSPSIGSFSPITSPTRRWMPISRA